MLNAPHQFTVPSATQCAYFLITNHVRGRRHNTRKDTSRALNLKTFTKGRTIITYSEKCNGQNSLLIATCTINNSLPISILCKFMHPLREKSTDPILPGNYLPRSQINFIFLLNFHDPMRTCNQLQLSTHHQHFFPPQHLIKDIFSLETERSGTI